MTMFLSFTLLISKTLESNRLTYSLFLFSASVIIGSEGFNRISLNSKARLEISLNRSPESGIG